MLRGLCAKCGKTKWFVYRRSFIAVKVDPNKPITTKDPICGSCGRKIKKVIKLT